MGIVYILQSLTNNRFYLGSTDNLERRIKQHNEGKAKYTSLTKPFKLVFSQEYPTLVEARKIEYKLKRLKSRKILEQIIFDGKINLRPD